MGCSSSCRIFEEFSSSLEWMARHKLGIESIIHILDDFLIIDQLLSHCGSQLALFLDLCNELGVPIAHEKTAGPCHVLSFARIELDCLVFETRLPREEIQKCLPEIEHTLSRKKVTLNQLQSLIGLLNFACCAIIPGRGFLRLLINIAIGVKRLNHYIRITHDVQKDLAVWKAFFQSIMANPCSLRTPGTLRPTLNFTPMLLNHWASVSCLVRNGHTTSGLVIALIRSLPSWNFFPSSSGCRCGEILWPIN